MSPASQQLKEKKISEVVNARLIQAPSSTSVKDAVALMRREQSAYIVVADAKDVVGILTETDVARKILGQKVDDKLPIRDFMTKDPVVLRPDDTVGKAIDLMAEHSFYHIPLVNERQELVGVLSVRTLIRFLSEFYPGEVYNLPPDLHQVAQTEEGG
jgi:CBS domain-containing protein